MGADNGSESATEFLTPGGAHAANGTRPALFQGFSYGPLLWAPFDSGAACSMGPCFVYGIELVDIGDQARGPY